MKLFMCIPLLITLISRCSPNAIPISFDIAIPAPRNNSQPEINTKGMIQSSLIFPKNSEFFDMLNRKRQLLETDYENNKDADDDIRFHIIANHKARDKSVSDKKSETEENHVIFKEDETNAKLPEINSKESSLADLSKRKRQLLVTKYKNTNYVGDMRLHNIANQEVSGKETIDELFIENQENASEGEDHEASSIVNICSDKLKCDNEIAPNNISVERRSVKRVIDNKSDLNSSSDSVYEEFLRVDERTVKVIKLFSGEDASLTLHYTQLKSTSRIPNLWKTTQVNNDLSRSKQRIQDERRARIKAVYYMLGQLFRRKCKTGLANKGNGINLIDSEVISVTTINESSSQVRFGLLTDINTQYAVVAIILACVLMIEIKMLLDEWNFDRKIVTTCKRCKRYALKKLRQPRSSRTVVV